MQDNNYWLNVGTVMDCSLIQGLTYTVSCYGPKKYLLGPKKKKNPTQHKNNDVFKF